MNLRNNLYQAAERLLSPPVTYTSNLASLGMFVFQRTTLPYTGLKRSSKWRHPSGSRVGARPVSQFVGPDDQTISIDGVLYPEITGGVPSLDQLIKMADEGDAWPLIEGNGYLYGNFVIEGIDESRSYFMHDGTARRIEFTIELKRRDPDLQDLAQPRAVE
ncbi:phage tail protein [Jeongeupia chitinilytica]|uniref:Tail assembly protein n=1 Tax=Jeongeupia chitinilytica TaxID=1041641 RepID=A0ABQ3GXC9_9NEIS|nr:phage tail protein [Jeongeupia chitinilytica]GHD59829.1 tail assembly protein [Jeongeupia chitinilytica]